MTKQSLESLVVGFVLGVVFAVFIAMQLTAVAQAQEGTVYKGEAWNLEGGVMIFIDGYPPLPAPQPIELYNVGGIVHELRGLSPDPIWNDPNQSDPVVTLTPYATATPQDGE